MPHDSPPPPTDAPLRIVPATPADVPTVLEFIRELAEYERLASDVVATEAMVYEALFAPAPAAEVLLARLGDATVGFALYFHNFSTFLGRRGLYLEDLFVRPAARGRGVGRALLAALARVAVDRGCGRMEWSVLDWNTPAIAFYESLGARPLAEWTVFRLAGDALTAVAASARAAPGDGSVPPGA
jgi:GNAT superfamily N-acetyltransferase